MIRHRGIEVDVRRGTIAWGWRTVRLSRRAAIHVARALIANAGGFVPISRFEDELWGGREDGGPDDTKRHIYMHISEIGRVLTHLRAPVDIECRHRNGYGLFVRPLTLTEAARHAA